MSQSERQFAFVRFVVQDAPALNRLATIVDEFGRHKRGEIEANTSEAYWLNYLQNSDRAEFWWPTEEESKRWDAFWFGTPLPRRHSPEMPLPRWDFGSLVDAILSGEYDIVGVRRLSQDQAVLEIDPHAYPYGGIDAFRALVRAFGHKIVGSDDGTGYVEGDPRPPPLWTP